MPAEPELEQYAQLLDAPIEILVQSLDRVGRSALWSACKSSVISTLRARSKRAHIRFADRPGTGNTRATAFTIQLSACTTWF
jgi:hypothetical protein